MKKSVMGSRYAALLVLAIGALQFSSSASAQRGIVIDQASQSNELASCTPNCFGLSIGSGVFQISATGSIRVLDGSNATFFVADSATLFQVLSGYTISGAGVRTDFVDFYQQGRSLATNSFGNREAPDFQIQLTSLPRDPYPDLEIAFAYLGSASVPTGATIGYRGANLGVQSSPIPPGSFGGFPAERLVTNDNGLLLGLQGTDSEFVFRIGRIPNTNFETVTGLLGERFLPRYAAVSAVPEPSTWAMMLFGFGAVGFSLRRRRRAPVLI